MRVSSKHTREFNGVLTRFLGGLNKSMPPHAIEDEQLIDATNFYYAPDTGYLTTREGLKKYTTAAAGGSVIGLYGYVKAGVSHVLLVTEETPQQLYELDSDPKPVAVSGDLTGTKRPSFATMNELCAIATGDTLQTYDDTTLATPAGAPKVDFISDQSKGTQNGSVARVIGCGNATTRERLFMCGINDLTNWTFDTTTEANAKYIDVGHKDGKDLIGIAQLLGYTLLFKKGPSASQRVVHMANLVDESQYWSAPIYRRMHSALSPHLIAEFGDGVLVVDVDGPKLFTAAAQPSDRIPFDIAPGARTIAGELAKAAASDGFIIVDPVKMIVMVKPQKNSDLFYCLDFINNRWTYFKFGINIQCGAYIGGKMLFGADDGFVYEYDSSLSTDNGVGYVMTAETKWWNIMPLFDELVKDKYLDMVGLSDGEGVLVVKKKGALKYSKQFSFSAGWWDWPTVNALAPEDWTEALEKTPIYTVHDTNVVQGDYMSIAVQITSGQCALFSLATRTAAAGRSK